MSLLRKQDTFQGKEHQYKSKGKMNYLFELKAFPDDASKLFEVAKAESGKGDRSELSIAKKGKNVIFNISAADHIALKASMNTVSKILSIYEKTKSLVD
jgi:tRNA threonylcarbamoyladenosine modification (KEOPS) complex  Pcc1 subunit